MLKTNWLTLLCGELRPFCACNIDFFKTNKTIRTLLFQAWESVNLYTAGATLYENLTVSGVVFDQSK